MKLINGILKLLALLAFSLAAGLLAIIFLSGNPQISPLILRLITLAAISFISSLFLRLFFRKGIAFLTILLAWITSTTATLAIDYFYDTEYLLSFLTKEFQFEMPTLPDIAQLAILLLVSLPALLIFRKKKVRKVAGPRKQTQIKPQGQSLSDRVKVVTYQINPMNWNIKLPKFGEEQISSVNQVAKVQISTASKPKGAVRHIKSSPTKKASVKKIKLPRFGSKTNNNDVKLMGDEEHVCPYCLEEVVKNDSRGVMVCPECATWHHKDCWDVIGACGIAHRNKL